MCTGLGEEKERAPEFLEHVVMPDDTLVGICLKYKVYYSSYLTVSGFGFKPLPSVLRPGLLAVRRNGTPERERPRTHLMYTKGERSRAAAVKRLRGQPFPDVRRPHHSQQICRWAAGKLCAGATTGGGRGGDSDDCSGSSVNGGSSNSRAQHPFYPIVCCPVCTCVLACVQYVLFVS